MEVHACHTAYKALLSGPLSIDAVDFLRLDLVMSHTMMTSVTAATRINTTAGTPAPTAVVMLLDTARAATQKDEQ